MVSKKDYLAIAQLIKDNTFHPEGKSDIILKDDFMEHLSDYFEKDNPNFDRDKFYKACYGKGGENGYG